MWSEIENKGKSKEKIRFGKGLPKWLSHRSTEVYRNSDPAEVPNRTEDFGRPLLGALEPDFFYNLSVPSLKVPSFLENFMHLQHLVTYLGAHYSKNQYFVQEVLLCISFQIS